ncbi:nucleoporin protein Ndc1-Nup [Phakopsora pachyrhizi]|uniref:Nucleoporin protein Ndc1-Nup n=1 Tax=Phakopsora pachyrhizi TaxID=170000 RepID=A0AAV0BSQ1_PHAPC|nr:nucleoporin protein Ndc1-Nup [Phakopsora pachyrhizi]
MSISTGKASESSKDSYVRLYQVVIRKRAGHFCLITYFICSFLLWVLMIDCFNALWNWFSFTIWIMSGASWASATVPMMILRKSQLRVSRLFSPNRYQRIIESSVSGSFLTSAFLCILSSTLVWLSYISSATALNEDPQLGFMKTVPGRRASQINERPFYLLASCTYVALCYAFVGSFEGRWYYRPSESLEKFTIPFRICKSLPKSFRRAQKITLFGVTSFLPLYLIVRRYVIRAIVFSKYVHLMGYIKPHLVMLIKFNSAFTLTSTIRLLMLNLFIVSIWEILQSCWDVYSTQPFDLSQFHSEPNRSLLEGIQSSDPRIQYHAFSELAHLSWNNPARRISIFKDIKTTPRILNLLIEECLKVIETVMTVVENRGQVHRSGTGNSSSKSITKVKNPPQLGYSALKNDLPQLFNNPPPKSGSLKNKLLDKLFSAPEVPTQSSKVPVSSSASANNLNGENQIPDVFQSPRRRNSPGQVDKKLSNPLDATYIPLSNSVSTNDLFPGRGRRREKVLPKFWHMLNRFDTFKSSKYFQQLETWLFSPLISAELEKCLGNRHICALAIEAVTNFTCASLTEDQYGVLQGQIPRILKTMVDCCDTLENYRTEICQEFGIENLQQENSSPDAHTQDLKITLDIFLDPMLSRLKDGTNGILEQFKPYLKEWTIDSQIQHWIQQRLPSGQA